MKKERVVLLASVLIILTSMTFAAAYDCNDGTSVTPCVCGHTPSSAMGYGQVIFGGASLTIISCDNIADGVCPEDFQDGASGIIGNCSNCPDPDCTSTVQGIVKDTSGRYVDQAVVTGHPVKWNESADLDKSTSTGTLGNYSFSGFITGRYYFSASKESYDTELIEATVIRGQTTYLNFTLQNGTCHEDCTDSYNRCNKRCDGITFDNSTEQCKFYSNAVYPTTVKDRCDTKVKGTEVYLGPGSAPDRGTFIKCCGDDEDVPYEKYYSKASADSGNIKNLIKTEKIAKYNNIPVRIIIAYWQN